MTERLLYPPELDSQAKWDPFDPGLEGSRHGISRDLSLAIWERVRADATDSEGRCNMGEARRRFHELAALLAARGGRLQSAVGRTTRVRTEILGEPFDDRCARLLAPRVPGRQTLFEVEARRRAQLDHDSAPAADAAPPAAKPELPGASDVTQSLAALLSAAPPARATPPATGPMPARGLLDLRVWTPQGRRDVGEPAAAEPHATTSVLRERLQHTFGGDARDVELRPDDGRVGAAEAVTVDETVFIGRWDDGDALLRVGHEVAHAIQQRRGRAAGETDAATLPSVRRASLELEAERAGRALVGGLPFAVRGAAPTTVALFRGGPALPPANQSPDEGTQQHDPEQSPEQRPGHERSPDHQGPGGDAKGEAAANPSDPAHADLAAGKDIPGGKDTPAGKTAAGPDGSGQAAQATPVTAHGAGPGGGIGAGPGPGAAAVTAGAVDASDPGSLLGSLEHAPPSSLPTTLTSVQAATPQAFQSMRTQVQAEMPKIPTPTGLPVRPDGTAPRDRAPEVAASPRQQPVVHPAPVASAQRTPETLVHEAPAAPPPAPTHLAGADDHGQGQAPAAHDPALAQSAQSALSGVRLGANQVSATATEVPSVEMQGETDPAQLDTAQVTAQSETTAAVIDARRATMQDCGEHDISPKADPEMLEAELASGTAGAAPGEGGAAKPAAPDALPAEARASIDAEASPVLHDKIDAEHQRYTAGKAQQDAAKRAAHEQTRAEIAQAETDARTRQTDAQAAARGEVTTARADWQHEIDHVDHDFRTQAKAARDQHRQGIVTEQQTANRKAAEHIQSAEKAADQEKRKAEAEAQKKKDEGKKESGGFFGWLKSKAKALIDGIKSAVNFIYDNLRKAVKAVFEAAKKLALGVIELARKAIVALIKAYGEVLKGLVKVALAAFPQLRDRILRRIDQAVQKATQVVNAIADGLKKAVTALIDFLAKTIDSILGLIQDLYNAALTVIGMLITGQFKELLQKLGQVISAAKTAPGQFETAAYEELLGGDLDQPLSPAELLAAGRTPPPGLTQEGDGVADAGPQGDTAPAAGDAAADAHAEGDHAEGGEPIPHPPWTEANVGVDQAMQGEQLEPELAREVQARTGGGDGTVELGESDDQTRSLDYMLGRTAGQDAAQPTSDNAAHSPEAQGGDAAQQPAAQLGADGLTPRERAAVKWQLMKKGLADWWSKNWPYVLAGGVLAVAGFIVANILTGGAILAALPAIMTVVGEIMMGVAILKIVEHVRDFLQKAWSGDIRGGGKSLAKGLAAGAIELIMLLTFKVGEAAVRGARVAARGVVRGAQAAARGAARAGRAAVRGVERGAEALARSSVRVVAAIGRGSQYVIRAGKVLLRGVGEAVARGVKSLRELGARLLSRTRFKGFRIRVAERRWNLEGRINPWVVLASGRIVEVDSLPKDAKAGNMVEDVVDGQPGRVVSVGSEPPDVGDVARALGEPPADPMAVQRAIRRLDTTAERIAELERKVASGRRLSQLENQELYNLREELKAPQSLSTSEPFVNARSDATRVMPLDAEVPPRQVPYVEQAQRLMNELNKPGATFGDGSVAMSIVGEQVAGGQAARAVIGKTLHYAKGVDHLQPLYRLIESGNLPRPAVQRLLQETHKIEQAVAWASQYRRAVAAGPATLDDLPSWAQAYRELLEGLRPH
jgi:hypothetical protein